MGPKTKKAKTEKAIQKKIEWNNIPVINTMNKEEQKERAIKKIIKLKEDMLKLKNDEIK